MNYFQARQVNPEAERPDAGKWRFTCQNDDRVFPVGHCANNCPGHDTPEEADKHYYDWEIDTAVFNYVSDPNIKYKCEYPECGHWTQKMTKPGGSVARAFPLCGRHSNKKGLIKAWPFHKGQYIVGS